MNLAEVKSLRSQQRYEEAAKLSRSLLRQQPDDIWQRRSHAWSLYFLIKKQVQAGEKTSAVAYVSEFDLLQISLEDTLIHEKVNYFRTAIQAGYLEIKKLIEDERFEEALDLQLLQQTLNISSISWNIYYFVRHQTKRDKPDSAYIHRFLTKAYQSIIPERVLVDKLILVQLIRLHESVWNAGSLSPYLEKLGLFQSLEVADFEPGSIDGKNIPSLAERIFIAYAKSLIKESVSSEKILEVIRELVEPILEPYSHMQYVPYFKAKLLLKIGNASEGMTAFLPFARKKQREFWVWQVMAECHQDQQDLHLSCLCKALTCKTKPEFLCGIKERITPVLLEKGENNWAKSELDDLIRIRTKNGWGLRSNHQKMLQQTWYISAHTLVLGHHYQPYALNASKLLEGSLEAGQKYSVVVTEVNPVKKMFGFISDAKQVGFTSFQVSPEPGDIFEIWGEFSGAFFRQTTLRSVEGTFDSVSTVRKIIQGKLQLPESKNFGFVDGVFVSPEMVKRWGLVAGQELKGLAVLAPVKRDGPLKWKFVKKVIN
jgi:hypothetical protein